MSSNRTSQSRPQDFIPIEPIGSGKSWVLYRARNQADGRIYHLKEIQLGPGFDPDKALKLAQSFAELEHPAIATIKWFWIGPRGWSPRA